jgi:hypothetical protein
MRYVRLPAMRMWTVIAPRPLTTPASARVLPVTRTLWELAMHPVGRVPREAITCVYKWPIRVERSAGSISPLSIPGPADESLSSGATCDVPTARSRPVLIAALAAGSYRAPVFAHASCDTCFTSVGISLYRAERVPRSIATALGITTHLASITDGPPPSCRRALRFRLSC